MAIATRSLRRTIDCDYTAPRYAAAFLRVEGDEAAFIETNTSHAVPKLLAALAAEGLAPSAVRWVVVTHVHLDHAGGAGALAALCPQATVLAHPRAARHLRDPARLVAGARAVYGDRRFDELYGEIAPVAPERVRELADGDVFPLGTTQLRALHTRGHAKHHLVVDDPAAGAVFTGDTFGLAYPDLQRAGTFAFASTSPTDFEPDEALASIDRVLGTGARVACLTHFGELTDLVGAAEQLRRWVELSARLVEQARASGPEAASHVAVALREAMAAQAARIGLALTDDDWRLLALDLDLNAQGLLHAAHA
jgi:glyoxylase-like metal-dependent hydrolase (beta-lactamase superfamily II)